MSETHGESARVAIAWLDRPTSRNALRPGDLERLVADAGAIASAGRAVVIAGRGDSFCAGFDLKLCAADPEVTGALLRELSASIAALSAMDVPVVIAAHGAAIAGGCALLSAADAVVTHRAAKLGYPVVRLGLSPGVSAPFMRGVLAGGAVRLLQLDPGLVDGVEATRLGLADRCVDSADQVLEESLAIAGELAAKPVHAYAATKRWLRELASLVGREPGLAVSLATAEADECRTRLAAL